MNNTEIVNIRDVQEPLPVQHGSQAIFEDYAGVIPANDTHIAMGPKRLKGEVQVLLNGSHQTVTATAAAFQQFHHEYVSSGAANKPWYRKHDKRKK